MAARLFQILILKNVKGFAIQGFCACVRDGRILGVTAGLGGGR